MLLHLKLNSLHEDVLSIFKAELRTALVDSLSPIKSELLSFRSELTSTISAVQQSVTGIKGTVAGMEQSLSTCTDDIERKWIF